MDARRLSLPLLVVLLPVPAQADRHTWECFGGISPEKQQAVAARLSCGYRLVGIEAPEPEPEPAPEPAPTPDPNQVTPTPPPIGDFLKGTARLRASTDTGATPARRHHGRQPTKGSLFLVAEAAEYIAGVDSGHTVDGWLIGLRYLFRGPGTIEPFLHAMGGVQHPPGPGTTAGGEGPVTGAPPPDDSSNIAAFGGGVDLEINPSSTAFIVPVFRLQVDVVKSWSPDVDPYVRATFGVSFRFEGHDK
jgi:hypothetical protein